MKRMIYMRKNKGFGDPDDIYYDFSESYDFDKMLESPCEIPSQEDLLDFCVEKYKDELEEDQKNNEIIIKELEEKLRIQRLEIEEIKKKNKKLEEKVRNQDCRNEELEAKNKQLEQELLELTEKFERTKMNTHGKTAKVSQKDIDEIEARLASGSETDKDIYGDYGYKSVKSFQNMRRKTLKKLKKQ